MIFNNYIYNELNIRQIFNLTGKNIDLSKYKNESARRDSLFTIIVHVINIEETTNYFNEQLEKINTLKDPVKKKVLNDTMYGFICYIKNMYKQESKINSLYLVNSKNVDEIIFSHSEIYFIFIL